MIMKSMETKSHFPFWDCLAKSSVRNIRQKDFCIWMFSMEDKKAIVNDVFEKFHDRFGFYPESTGSYYMDAELINYVKEAYPSVKCCGSYLLGGRPESIYIPVTTPGIHFSMAAHGHHGFHPSRIHMRRQQIRQRTVES